MRHGPRSARPGWGWNSRCDAADGRVPPNKWTCPLCLPRRRVVAVRFQLGEHGGRRKGNGSIRKTLEKKCCHRNSSYNCFQMRWDCAVLTHRWFPTMPKSPDWRTGLARSLRRMAVELVVGGGARDRVRQAAG